jgi:hypothetical protein
MPAVRKSGLSSTVKISLGSHGKHAPYRKNLTRSDLARDRQIAQENFTLNMSGELSVVTQMPIHILLHIDVELIGLDDNTRRIVEEHRHNPQAAPQMEMDSIDIGPTEDGSDHRDNSSEGSHQPEGVSFTYALRDILNSR